VSSAGALTFLFTDLESSTRLWEQFGDAMAAALARHDALLRTAVERNGGRVVKTTGDGTYAVFSSADAGVRAAAHAQELLAQEPWEETGPLRARIALHTGVAEERDGDYFGPTLNRTARLMAIGSGGQVLVSQSTEALVSDREAVGFIDLGVHRLRDLTRPERVYQLVVPSMRADFPPLSSLDSLPTNLPVQLTTFIGREDELSRICAALTESRAVTITGVGGVGKTRLALQAASELLSEFADGVWVCELASAGDEITMVAAVATTFGVQGRPGATLDESVVDFFRAKQMLWVVDNCEHLLEPVARLVDRVLRASPGVKVLSTSREALDVDGERAVPLRSMRTASTDDVDRVNASDAPRLFVERAAEARAGFGLDASNAAAVNTICRRLDGIPLAIELAAARVVSMTPGEIAARLDERFRLLTGGRRIAVERHQTLRAAVEWSYELLEERERAVFARLAVFAGGFDGAAARAVATGEDVVEWDVIDAIDSLVRKSLVIADDEADSEIRYQLLETLRQYAQDRLDEDGSTDKWRRRHAEYFAELTTHIGDGLLGPEEFRWRTRLYAELDNIKAATAWAIDRDDAALALQFIASLADEVLELGTYLGHPATRALHLAESLAAEDRDTLLTLAAHEAWALGEVGRAFELAHTAVFDRDGGTSFGGVILPYHVILGSATWGAGTKWSDAMNAATLLTPETVEFADMHPARRARTYCSISTYALQVNHDVNAAQLWAQRAYELATETENPRTLAQALFVYGMAYAPTDPDAALNAYQRCVDVYPQRVGAGTLAANARYTGALLLARRGELELALQHLRESIEILKPAGRNAGLDGAFGYAIEILILCGAFDDALVLIGSVLGGVLRSLRDMSVPPDRTIPSVAELRELVGRAHFDADVARGKSMSYDELISWLLETLAGLLSARHGAP
jgi:predicted ATPase/class 3 adenylate cyclase